MKFTGGDNLTGFKKLINDIFMHNELYNGDGGYEISHAKAGRSGYSCACGVDWSADSKECNNVSS